MTRALSQHFRSMDRHVVLARGQAFAQEYDKAIEHLSALWQEAADGWAAVLRLKREAEALTA